MFIFFPREHTPETSHKPNSGAIAHWNPQETHARICKANYSTVQWHMARSNQGTVQPERCTNHRATGSGFNSADPRFSQHSRSFRQKGHVKAADRGRSRPPCHARFPSALILCVWYTLVRSRQGDPLQWSLLHVSHCIPLSFCSKKTKQSFCKTALALWFLETRLCFRLCCLRAKRLLMRSRSFLVIFLFIACISLRTVVIGLGLK